MNAHLVTYLKKPMKENVEIFICNIVLSKNVQQQQKL